MNKILAICRSCLILGYELTRAIFEPETTIYYCPFCDVVIKKFDSSCNFCKNKIGWD